MATSRPQRVSALQASQLLMEAVSNDDMLSDYVDSDEDQQWVVS